MCSPVSRLCPYPAKLLCKVISTTATIQERHNTILFWRCECNSLGANKSRTPELHQGSRRCCLRHLLLPIA